MSVTVEYLFNTDTTLSELAQLVNQVLGCSLAAYEGNAADQFCRFFGFEFTLETDHGMERDRELDFDDYRYILYTRTPAGDSDLRQIQVGVMVFTAFALHQRLGIDQGMLTFDLQRLLARYDTVDGAWTDKTSGKVVRFPEHMADIANLVEGEL